MMRRFTFVFFTLCFCLISFNVFTNASGPTSGVAGEPPLNQTCAAAGCHTGSALNSGGGTATIICKDSLGNIVSAYDANRTYTITLGITEGVKTRYGFEAIVMKGTGSKSAGLGTIILTDAVKTQLFGNPKNILHKFAGIDFPTMAGTWSFNWKAPNANYGTATVYAAFNAANKDGGDGGDKIYTKALALTGNGTQVGVNTEKHRALARIFPNPATTELNFDLLTRASIWIYNAEGKEVKRFENAQYSINVDIQDLSKGLYFVVVKNEESQEIFKLIKQ